MGALYGSILPSDEPDIVRLNDAEKLRVVSFSYYGEWTDEQSPEAEAIISGIEYATLMRPWRIFGKAKEKIIRSGSKGL